MVGGILVQQLGLRPTLVVSGVGTLGAAVVAYLGAQLATDRVARRLRE
ncbi:MAG TPA: hypothetical protein VE953_00460 [Terriglobales bacterium]|nr:hypothetical protein [Terriglobales bacterium]